MSASPPRGTRAITVRVAGFSMSMYRPSALSTPLPAISISEGPTVFSTCGCVTVVIVAQYTKRPSKLKARLSRTFWENHHA